jgi:hypothetical protein
MIGDTAATPTNESGACAPYSPAIGRQARMKQPGRQMLAVAAVALIEPHDVHAGREGFRRESLHVMRVARSVQAVKQQNCRLFPGALLPMTIGDNARVECDIEEAARRRRQSREVARVPPAVKGHPVAVAKIRPRLEGVHPPDDTISPSLEASCA